ncbi:frataxin, mitochondrial [Apis mellifera caucasica]|uniref:ferroxidase n=1 Tax=Apis mellifera TaxID=7460 RepID=A0A7M7TFX8_APIME|nr:frataxin homolog, mitochondrial [Apis mellifera]KAG6799025.1 frataxin, mitochondrial [Apis mellifera caucasica]KAG9432531.1 frataxin, mitochondrial [Apis mellifera carnica]|eukprot:XP_625012.1 frataxin homolog, mitochondrial [Apis mellifera]
MLLTRGTIKHSVFKILSYDLVKSIINKCLIQEINVKCQTNIGYHILHFKKNLNINKDLKILSYESIAHNHCNKNLFIISSNNLSTQELTSVQFEKVSDETLTSLTEYFDELVEQAIHLSDADVSYGDGVLTIKFGDTHGTYVINRQSPNRQIWLSSPKSGPKRYDFIDGKWIYKYDRKTLHELLDDEIPAIIGNQTNFNKCSFSGK